MFKKSLLQLISINNFKFLSISQTTSIRIEHSSSNTENLFVSNFKIADLFLITEKRKTSQKSENSKHLFNFSSHLKLQYKLYGLIYHFYYVRLP